MKNPILEEIWRFRQEFAAKFDYDPHRIGDYLRKKHAELGIPAIPPPKRRRKKAA